MKITEIVGFFIETFGNTAHRIGDTIYCLNTVRGEEYKYVFHGDAGDCVRLELVAIFDGNKIHLITDNGIRIYFKGGEPSTKFPRLKW